jgi:Fe-S cluster biogenesis protein NfuA
VGIAAAAGDMAVVAATAATTERGRARPASGYCAGIHEGAGDYSLDRDPQARPPQQDAQPNRWIALSPGFARPIRVFGVRFAGFAVGDRPGVTEMTSDSTTKQDGLSGRSALLSRIEQVLDEKVRPELRADGGDIVLVGIDPDNIVQVRLTGACEGCSSSVVTLSMRVEATLKIHVPEIRFIEAVP